MYGLVGLTGGSLHYLAEDFGQWLGGRSTGSATHITYHRHGSDNHWHFHSHAGVDSEESTRDTQSQQCGVRSKVEWHTDHECPLLTVLSNLKMGFAPTFRIFAAPVDSVDAVVEPEANWTRPTDFDQFARGPPRSLVA
jgi:hypothetical protein